MRMNFTEKGDRVWLMGLISGAREGNGTKQWTWRTVGQEHEPFEQGPTPVPSAVGSIDRSRSPNWICESATEFILCHSKALLDLKFWDEDIMSAYFCINLSSECCNCGTWL